MRTMFLGSILDHELMHIPTEQGIFPQLKWLSEARLLQQEIQTLLCILILLVLAMAVCLVRRTDRLRQGLPDMFLHHVGRGSVELLAHGIEKCLEEEIKPPEDGVVALNLAVRAPLHPGVDGDGDDEAERRRVEGEDGRGAGNVVVGDELGDIVGYGDAHETDVVGFREEAEDVFGVEFAAVKRSGDVDAAFNLGSGQLIDREGQVGCNDLHLV